MAAEDEIPELLIETLGELSNSEFKSFRYRLRDLEKIPWGELEPADREETLKLMQKHFKSNAAAATTMLDTLKKIKHNQLAERLENGLKRFAVVKDEPSQPSKVPGQVDSKIAAAFVDTNMAEIIGRVEEVMPIADKLRSQGIIGQETYNTIKAATTSNTKMRNLYDGLRASGAPGKLAFFKILMEKQRLLVEELWAAE